MAAGSATGQTGPNAWSQLDQLLTCAICLDRYRNPKLLPCQHTFCMEPCLEGLIDYVRRQIKCPECRAEHRIPYQGIQGYPTNVTLMRFLELHFEVTGEVPDPTPAMMERCGVCTEKSYLGHCAHCEKKVCTDCKEAHLDIMKREISRINNQVRRGLNRLQDALAQTGKSTQQLQTNCKTVLEEIEEIYRRLQKGLKDREEALKAEVLTFMQNELRGAESLKENLDTEVSNIQSNCELVEKHVTENAEWDDVELMEYKDTFLRTLEFLRNFDPDQADFNRRLKFQLGPEPEAVHQQVVSVGELTISAPNFPGSHVTSTVGTVGGVGGMLMRSKSEHRLASTTASAVTTSSSATQAVRHDGYLGFAQRISGHQGGQNSDNEARDGRSSPLGRRRTGDLTDSIHQLRRSINERGGRDYEDGGERSYRRYGRDNAESRWQRDDGDYTSSYRSRLNRENAEIQRDSSDGDVYGSRFVRFARQQQEQLQEQTIRERVLETEDATRGPLSGICRLMDSPRVMERLQQQEQRQKQQLTKQQQPPAPVSLPVQPPPVTPVSRARTARQVSEEDEIAKQKAQNKKDSQTAAVTETPAPTPATPPPPPESPTRPLVRRLTSLQRETQSQAATEAVTESEMQRRRYTARTEDTSDVPRRPASRQMSDSEVPARPPSRQTSVVETKETLSGSNDKSTASSESSSKEDDSPLATNRRRFFTRNQSERSGILKANSSAINESNSDDESDSDAKTPTPSTGLTAATLARQGSLEDINGQEKPNYFRFRTAAYSRSPSNSSVNLDSQDESGRSGALSPTPPQSSQQFARPKTPGVTNATTTSGHDAKERTKSTDSSSSGSDSSSNAAPIRTPSSTTTTPTTSSSSTATVDKNAADSKSSIASRYAPFRSSATTTELDKKDSSAKDDGYSGGISSGRGPSLASTGRTTSLDKKSEPPSSTKPRFVSRFLPRTSSLCKDDKHDSDSSSSDSEDNVTTTTKDQRRSRDADTGASPISALLARSAIARRDNGTGSTTGGSSSGGRSAYARDRDVEAGSSRRTGSGSSYLHGRDDYKKDAGDSTTEGRYSSLASKYLSRSRTSLCNDDDSNRDEQKYGSYASRYLSKSKSSAALSFEKADDGGAEEPATRRTSLSGYGSKKDSPASRYSGAAARRSRLGRSKSSHEINGGEEEEDEDMLAYRPSRYERPSATEYSVARSRSQHALNSRDASPEADVAGSSALSSWARYLKAKYGNKGSSKQQQYDGPTLGRSRSSHALYSREASSESSEEEPSGTRDATRRDSTVSYSPGYGGLNSAGAENPRSAYLQKKRVLMKIGARGSERGSFTWPRGIAVGLDNSIVVADSSNHRVQVFDAQGSFCREFGTYGNAEGEFDCLAGVAVNRIGQYIVSDRYNHRIQVFDPSGRFLRAFGSQGSTDGKLSYPWGIATDSLGFIYVCDKENHRVQVFQSDGTFVGKFGSLGNKAGQLEHPHYIAVSNTNKVVVSDSNNHRVQIFDVNGRVLSTFGGEGSDEGQFKFPRGVAVDDQGYIVVGDSGNNRIQVFEPDGTFFKSYGTWGSGDGEFKGLEGVAVTSNANILVCDRENHRIQIF